MSKERRDNQAVDAFSAPRSLIRAAQEKAKAMRLTKSGFYRYCLAKELGKSEEESLRVAEHGSVGQFGLIKDSPNSSITGVQKNFSGHAPKPLKYKIPRKKKGL
jgi:hypothetical protein